MVAPAGGTVSIDGSTVNVGTSIISIPSINFDQTLTFEKYYMVSARGFYTYTFALVNSNGDVIAE